MQPLVLPVHLNILRFEAVYFLIESLQVRQGLSLQTHLWGQLRLRVDLEYVADSINHLLEGLVGALVAKDDVAIGI